MDIEWAKDGINGELYIVQVGPETVHSSKNALQVKEYKLLDKGAILVRGEAIGSKIAPGVVRILKSPVDGHKLKPADIVVTELTSPDWDPIHKDAAAIVTNKGGRTSHTSMTCH